jgi:NADPH-dependent 2,4-dienoyl-CoA reductase/sulfur reductase-like enzyme
METNYQRLSSSRGNIPDFPYSQLLKISLYSNETVQNFSSFEGQQLHERIKNMTKERLLVIGGNAAGMTAAAKARRMNTNLEIKVFEKGAHVSYAP